jgi:polar amino acid transport system substrate-binding protein
MSDFSIERKLPGSSPSSINPDMERLSMGDNAGAGAALGGLTFRSLHLVVMVFLATVGMGAQVPVPSAKQPLIIAAEDGAGPWGQTDGTGCGNDIVLAAYAAVKVPVKLEVMPYARAKSGALSGGFVACFGMAWTPELEGKILFADKPLYRVTAVLIQATARPLNVTEGSALKAGTKVGTVLGYEYPPVFYELVKQGKLVGRVEPAFVLGVQGTYIGFSRAHPLAEYARTKFDDGFARILKDGTYKRILDSWKAKTF